MGMLLQAAVLLSSLLLCSAFLDLSGPREIKAVWKGSVTLPCAYMPVEDLVQQTLTWSVVHDQSTGTIFRRDGSEDHVLLSEYRARVSVPKDTPGNVSLVILNLEVTDRGTYTCQVTWRASNNSLIAKEITTKVEVVKVPATKPIIRAGELGLTVPAGASTSLTCEASGSPPISYRWFRSIPGGKVPLQSSGAELVWDNLRPSDSGMYFCEAANRAGAGVAQQSDAVELTVTDLFPTTLVSRMDTAPEGPVPDTGGPPAPLLYGPALGGAALAALGAVAMALRWRRRRKEDPLYEVSFHSTAGVTALEAEVEVPVKCLHKETCCNAEASNDTFTVKDRKSPEYENLVTAMESEYETEGI